MAAADAAPVDDTQVDMFDALDGQEQRMMDQGFDAGEAQGRETGMAEGWAMGCG